MALPSPRLGRGYAYFAWLFAFSGLGALGMVGVSLYGRAEIVLTAAQRRASGEYLVAVHDLPFDAPVADPTVVPGKIQEQVLELERTFPAGGQAAKSAGTAGEVTLVNTTSRSQTLVATTRLLAPTGVLLRLQERVVVPAAGQVRAVIYPDQPEALGTLAPTRFTIPGLAVSLQDKIYAFSETTLPDAGGTVPVVTAGDLSRAQAALTQALNVQALAAFEATLGAGERLYSKLVYQEVLSSSADAAAGDQRQEFVARQQLKVVTVAFDEVRLVGVVRRHLGNQLPSTHELLEIDPSSLRYETERFDPVRREVILKAYAEGRSSLRAGSPLLDPAVISGLTKAQIVSYFKRYPEISSVEVKFSPQGLPRAPRTPSRITFTVQ